MRLVPLFVLLPAALAAQGTVPAVTRVRTIGCESCGGPTQFGTFYDVSVAPDGTVLVSDKNAPILRKFDAAGKLVWSGGQRGKGPGEFLLPFRTALTNAGIVVIDMTNSRLTRLDLNGKVNLTIPITSLPTTAAVSEKGEVIVGMDDFGRSFRIVRVNGDRLEPVATLPGSLKNKSVALAPDGSMAYVADGDVYEIQRLDPSGKIVGTIRREIDRPKRSEVEEAEYRDRLGRGMAAMAAEMKKQGMSGSAKPLPIPPAERGLKGHVVVDGLRYDGAGRLWVWTQRGDESKTVFDVFSPAGTYLGAVTIPARVNGYSVSSNWLATVGEDENGIPVVTVWKGWVGPG